MDSHVGSVGGLGIGIRIRLEQHGLLVEIVDANANDSLAVAVVIVSELRELLACDEEVGCPWDSRSSVSGSSIADRAHSIQCSLILRTNSLKIF